MKENFSINHRRAAETGFAGDELSFREDGQPGSQSADPGDGEPEPPFLLRQKQVFAFSPLGRAPAAAGTRPELRVPPRQQAPALAPRLAGEEVGAGVTVCKVWDSPYIY